ncbi:SIS domain-containing protein [bacterium]|nr:SIS domain-containing protein [bacterium]MBU3956603.1 SIS domain-containing protein [bacterium]
MKDFIKNYYFEIKNLFDSIKMTDNRRKVLNFFEGVYRAAELIKKQIVSGKKLIFIGNGASASISSHLATDYWKNGGMRAIAFNDAALITCVSNDIGYKHVFEKSIEMFADKGDILIAISSSGKSENILRGVKMAKKKKCKIITLSGFKSENPLRKLGNLNFYVPSSVYGHVEILHHSICHCILEYIMESRK